MPAKTDKPKKQIRIRMYRVGFGDCFLLTLPGSTGPAHILVDCGVHARGDIHTIEKAVDDIASVTNKKISIVIATHAHQDHVSGFGAFAPKFAEFDVKEVWLPWTENPNDAGVAQLKSRQMALVENLKQHFAAQGRQVNAAVKAALVNLSGNQAAFELLQSGFHEAEVKYLEAGQEMKDPAGIPGLKVKILGPPRDKEFLAKMDPPGGQRYLRMAGSKVEAVGARQPFQEHFRAKPDEPGPRLSEADKKSLQQLAASTEDLAFALDQVINNTSVVTLFQYRGQNMLFPGDAQYGNWNFWLEKSGADRLLSQVNFYKVSHHGSVNATPKSALEKMTTGRFAAMLSTQNQPWPSIPGPKLLDALERKAAQRVIRSDSLEISGAPTVAIPRLPRGFQKGDLWYDYLIDVDG